MGASFKQSVVREYISLLKEKELSSSELLLVTPMGIITGTPVFSPGQSVSSATKAYYRILSQASEDWNGKLSGDDGCLLLENVSIYSGKGGQTFSLDALTVFFDQIIGASIRGSEPNN